MDDIPFRGTLSDIPLPRALYLLWQRKKTGRLHVARRREERRLSLLKGLLALDHDSLDEGRFLEHLRKRGLLKAAPRNRRSGDSRPFVQSLAREGVIDPPALWNELEEHFRARLAELFEWPEGSFEFVPSATLDFDLLLAGMSTPDLILDGIRLMTRLKGVEAWLAREKDPWQALSPALPGPASLKPHERYVFHLLSEGRTAEDILSRSRLGRTETAKVLFALACAGLAGPAAVRPHLKTPAEFSFADYDKILAHFKNKAGVISRYVSKEVGPVGLSILGKALEEVNGWLGPGLPRVALNADGCPDVKALLRGHSGLFREEDAKNLFRVLDEILAAEVLMVKRTLGDEHESALVRALER
jgi:hypothetical protein